jgi:hypothetical protein
MSTLFLYKYIKNLLKKQWKFAEKKSAQNTFHIFTIVWYNLKHFGMQSGTTQSLFFLFYGRILGTAHIQHELQTTWLQTADWARFFFNSATICPQKAAPNRGVFSEIFPATQARVQVVNLIVHTQIYRHELHSGAGGTASWKRPSLTRAWASKC